MCGRYRLSAVERVEERFETEQIDEVLHPRYNIAPSQEVPISRQADDRRSVSFARWGLVPFWAKDASVGYKLINARAETAAQKPAFRQSFAMRRCLIPADGFYEWSKLQKIKRPFLLGMSDDSLFGFAGLWDVWRSPEGNLLESCTILTTTPNTLVSDLHSRMPVIIPREHYEKWLAAPAPEVAKLLLPFNAGLMRRYEISSLVNNPKNENPDCITPAEPNP